MTVTEYIRNAPAERQATLTTLHETILANDPTVTPVVKMMMGKEMIMYEERCYMKYALASTKNYMSLANMSTCYLPPNFRKAVSILLTPRRSRQRS